VESTEAQTAGLPRLGRPICRTTGSAAAALLLHPQDRPVQGGPAALRIGVAGAAALPRHEADEVVEPEGEEPEQLDDEDAHGPDDDPEERLTEELVFNRWDHRLDRRALRTPRDRSRLRIQAIPAEADPTA
jgi:hypothetical protein